MENLQELVYVVNQSRIRRIDIMDTQKHNQSKINSLFNAIKNGKIHSDKEAFELLYPNDASKSAYNNLKSKLRDKLINTIFFIDFQQAAYTDRQIAFFEVHKDYAAAQILLAKNAHKSAIILLEKLYKKCKFYEFSELNLLISRALCLHYSTRMGNEKKYYLYDKERLSYQEVVTMEGRAESCYSQLILQFVNNKSTKPELAEKAKVFREKLLEDSEGITTYKFHLFMAFIQLFKHTCTNDYPATLLICDKIIAFFEQKPYTAVTPIQLCRHHQLVAYIQLEDYVNAKQVAELSQLLTQAGTFNWFNNLEYLFLLAMHTARFQEAYEIFNRAVTHKRFSFLPETVSEMWEIYRAYLHLMIDLGKVKAEEGNNNFIAFRLQRFLNSIPTFSKDKQGMNISILIVQILFYMQKKKYDLSIDRIETIEKYCTRYLIKPDTVRSYYFIKALLSIPQAGFHRVAVERYAKSNLKKLKEISSEFSQQFHKIEIIPYEFLWDLALEMLDNTSFKMKNIE